MRLTEILDRASSPLISYEIIPPKRGSSIRDVLAVVEQLLPFDPPFIDVTSHAAEVYYEELQDGVVKRHVKRKRPGTLGMCAAIRSKYGIETVPHLLCEGFTREETEDALIELNYLGVRNVMALRGDSSGYQKPVYSSRTRNEYAAELVQQIAEMNGGQYLEDLMDAEPTDFCIGVAGYPEKHLDAPNLKRDVLYLKEKVDAGAHYIVTQMFFDNKHFFTFVEMCREAGITVPIIPGLKILSSRKQITTLPRNFFIDIPEELADQMENAHTTQHDEIGVRWAIRQADELMSAGYSIHFYIMQSARLISEVVSTLRQRA